MFERIWVTNRHLSSDFLADFLCVAKSGAVDKILLRESDLKKDEYEILTKQALEISNHFGIRLILHCYFDVAKKLQITDLHLPFNLFLNFKKADFNGTIGVSIHDLHQALLAQNLGADYVVAGHIFDTPSHQNSAGKKIEFLEKIVKNLKIRVYAIGGINSQNINAIKQSGASGAYMMREILNQIKGK